jgi:transposase-like protein
MTKRFSEEDKETIWDMREAGVPVKRIAKHLDRQNSSLRKFIADHGGGGRLPASAPSSVCRSRNVRRSREVSPVDSLSRPSPQAWSGPRRPSAVR